MTNALLQVLTNQTPEYTPAAPVYPSLFLDDFERNYYIEQYRLRIGDQGCYPIDHAEDTLIRASALYQSYGIFKIWPDWIEVHCGASRAWAKRTQILQREGVLYYCDRESGVEVPMHSIKIPRGDQRLHPENSYHYDIWDTSSSLRGQGAVDKLLPIPSSAELLEAGHFDLPKQVVADYGARYFISTVLDTPYSDAYELLGFQGLMVIQHDRPELFHYLLERRLALSEQIMAAWASTGIHGVFVEEVFTGADMISPASYEEFVFAYNQPYFQKMCQLGLIPIHYVCGDVVPRLDRMCELDIAAIAVEESKKNFQIRIEDVVKGVNGRKVVFGNIDAPYFGEHASLAELEAEVMRQRRIGQTARGFVVSTGSPFPPDTNPRRIDWLVKTARRPLS